MVTKCPSLVRIRVERNPSDSTAPVIPPTLIICPSSNGLSPRITSEPKKFATVSFAANATAKPPIPRPAKIDETGLSLNDWAICAKTKITKVTRRLLLTIGTSMSLSLLDDFVAHPSSAASTTSISA